MSRFSSREIYNILESLPDTGPKFLRNFIPIILAFVFGLGLPKSFSLLYAVLFLIWLITVRPKPNKSLPRLIVFSSLLLFFFGISYSVMQILNTVWMPVTSYIPEIVAISVLPAACLYIGAFVDIKLEDIAKLVVLYATGSLAYAVLSVLISHQPWHNFNQVFPHVLRSPWGSVRYLSVRAIEQRAFLVICFLPAFILALVRKITHLSLLALLYLPLLGFGFYVVYSTNSRLFLPPLLLSLIPLSGLINKAVYKQLLYTSTMLIASILAFFGKLCDERIWLQYEFVRHAGQSFMGGRKIIFRYRDCVPGGFNNFGSFDNANTFTPHNVFLDIYNDGGVIPASFFIIAFTALMLCLGRLLFPILFNKPSLYAVVLWTFASVYICQLLTQPFLYTDQLFFTIGFLTFGCSVSALTRYRNLNKNALLE